MNECRKIHNKNYNVYKSVLLNAYGSSFHSLLLFVHIFNSYFYFFSGDLPTGSEGV